MKNMKKHQSFNEGIEGFYIQEYVRNSGPAYALIEHPIVSVKQNQIRKRQSIPDAIINILKGLSWVEHTSFSDSPEALRKIFIVGRSPEKFNNRGLWLRSGPNKPLTQSFLEALSKKLQKDHTDFLKITKLKKGILLIIFINESPFFDEVAFEELVSFLQDEYLLGYLDFSSCPFEKIVFGARVMSANIELRFETIADSAVISRLNYRQEVKKRILRELGERDISLPRPWIRPVV